ncbi:DUF5798 family protein [Haloprofundus salilacus]|uniref:DUF5798 family protein n=1 Tax=Haloprofundus salilacus TaxID=2876190 RepID=UPI001CC97D7D|nr:DUF5798 family protein [Haloprofundus salilacus]
MGLGNTARTLQKVADMGEDVYKRLNEVREQMKAMQDTVAETNNRVSTLEAEVAEQRALLEAVAEAQDIDVDAVTAEAHIAEAEDEAADAEASTADSERSEDGEAVSDDSSAHEDGAPTTTDGA